VASFSSSGVVGTGGTKNPDLVAPGKSIISLAVPGSFIDQTWGASGGGGRWVPAGQWHQPGRRGRLGGGRLQLSQQQRGGQPGGARGTAHLVDNGVTLSGEQDSFATPVATATLAAKRTAGTAWTGGTDNGQVWTGSSFNGTNWTATT
jgi:hypothetical protein